jgi:intein/homing endonuclease
MKDETVDLQYFNKIDSNNKAYLLGFIAADGAIVKQQSGVKSLTITIHAKDVSILELLKKELNSSLSIKIINYKFKSLSSYKLDVDHRRFTISRKPLIEGLENIGLTSNKSLTMPNLLINIPDEYKKAFIIGYFDGDGSFIDAYTKRTRKYLKKDGSYSLYTGYKWNSHVSIRGTYDFLKGIADYLQLKSYTLKRYNDEKIHSFRIFSNEGILKFYNCYNHCDFHLSRKKDKFTRKIIQVQTISPPTALSV